MKQLINDHLKKNDLLLTERPRILEGFYLKRLPGRKPGAGKISKGQDTGRLLLSMAGSSDIRSSLYHLMQGVIRLDPRVRNARQIRQSVIIHWLKSHNLRQVQYMAGHRWVSSTEHYLMGGIEDLQQDIGRYHPL